eukprot:5136655-Ditylum_brightwellii.AAC.1
MVGTAYDIKYKNNVFEYPELRYIHGKPITTNILTLCHKIQANTYANIPGTQPHTRLVLPMITIPSGAIQHVITQLHEQYTKDLCQFREANNMERAIVQQMVAFINLKFLKTLSSSITNKITASIPNIIQHLLDTYGNATPS